MKKMRHSERSKESEATTSPVLATNPTTSAAASGPASPARRGEQGEFVREAGAAGGGRSNSPLLAEEVEHPPTLLFQPAPNYPESARRRGVEGEVLLQIVVDTTGRVESNIKILQSIPLLDVAALEAVRKWRFTPGRGHNDRPVRVLLEVPLRFTLRAADGEASGN